MAIVNRVDLLQKLESVLPGLSSKEIVEQSSYFAFKDGVVMTFNGEDACRQKCSLDIEGAIPAKNFLAMLQKLTEETLDINVDEGEVVVKGKRRTIGFRMESKVLMPIDKVETPGDWYDLPEDFKEAIEIVLYCTGTNESKFYTTCVHLCPKWVEASDGYQLTRFSTKTNLEETYLIRASSARALIQLGVNQVSETKAWLHFKNDSGLVYSCARLIDDFPDISKHLECEGKPVTFPKGLVEACDKAALFSSENKENDQVTVELLADKLRLSAVGHSGWYVEPTKAAYNGPPLTFTIAPKLLAELTKRHSECEVSEDRLRVDGGKFIYVTALGKVEG